MATKKANVYKKKKRKSKSLSARSKIKSSDHFPTYDRWVRSGWSGMKCARKAIEIFGEKISHDAFTYYRNKLPLGEVVNVNILGKRMEDVDMILDAVSEMATLLIFHKQRIKAAYGAEKKFKLPLPIVNEMVKIAQGLLVDYATLVGEIKPPGTSVNVQTNVYAQQLPEKFKTSANELEKRIRRIVEGKPAIDNFEK